MKSSWLILGFFLSLTVQAQKSDTLTRYFTAGFDPTSRSEGSYLARVFPEGKNWGVRVLNDSGKVLMTGSYRDKSLLIRDGIFTYYYPSGQSLVRGRYSNNSQTGPWSAWHANGRVRDSVFFIDGYKQGKSWGWHENGQLMHEGFYRDGAPDSSWNWYYPNGVSSTRELYRKGKLQVLECFDSTGTSTGNNCSIDVPPTIKGRYGGLQKYILDSLYYPKAAIDRNIQGIVEVQFTITRDGQLKDIRYLNAPDPVLMDEVTRLLRSIPGWYPAVMHNQVMDYTQTLKIPFFRSGSDDE